MDNLKPDFTGLTLLIPDKADIERDEVANKWSEYGGIVEKIGRFWEPPDFKDKNLRVYGNHIFCIILAQKLNIELISPADEVIRDLEYNWIKRKISFVLLKNAQEIKFPCFIKPVVPKLFTAKVYGSYEELEKETKGLEETTEVLCSDIIKLTSEVRFFILENQIMTYSEYEGKAELKSAEFFVGKFIAVNSHILPKTYVLDIGFVEELGWVVIEFNSSWGAGLNGCDPLGAAICIANGSFQTSKEIN